MTCPLDVRNHTAQSGCPLGSRFRGLATSSSGVDGQDEPWTILTGLPPGGAGASWHEMRFWIETGFKALKSVGWQWQKTRRIDPGRVERRELVLSVATPLTLALGSRAEDAQALKRSPSAAVSRACFALACRP